MTLQPIWITEDAPVHAFPDVEFRYDSAQRAAGGRAVI